MKIDRAEFLKKLRKCRPGVELTNARLEGSDCFIFKKGRMYSYNGYISVSVPIEYEFEGVIAANELIRIVSAFKAKDIEVTVDEAKFVLECGRAKASINLMPESIFKQILNVIPSDPLWKKLPEGFVASLKDCLITNVNPLAALKIDGVYVDSTGVFSTDKVVINFSKFYTPMEHIWLTSKMTHELIKFETLEEYVLEESWAIFKSEDMIFACRKYVDNGYPLDHLKSIITNHKTDKMRGDTNTAVFEAITNALIMGDEKETRMFINLEFLNDGIRVFSERHKGSYSEFVECPVQNWEHLTISVDGGRLKQALKLHPDSEFHIGYVNEEASAFILHKGSWTELFMIYKE